MCQLHRKCGSCTDAKCCFFFFLACLYIFLACFSLSLSAKDWQEENRSTRVAKISRPD